MAALSATASRTGCTSVGEAADDAQDGAGRGLLFERLAEIAVARLDLLEQPHVLDGDHRLVGEGLGQFDLLGVKGPGVWRSRTAGR